MSTAELKERVARAAKHALAGTPALAPTNPAQRP